MELNSVQLSDQGYYIAQLLYPDNVRYSAFLILLICGIFIIYNYDVALIVLSNHLKNMLKVYLQGRQKSGKLGSTNIFTHFHLLQKLQVFRHVPASKLSAGRRRYRYRIRRTKPDPLRQKPRGRSLNHMDLLQQHYRYSSGGRRQTPNLL